MKSFEKLYTELESITGESSTAHETLFKTHINDTQRIVANKCRIPLLEDSEDIDTVDGTNNYLLPRWMDKVITAFVTVDDDPIYRPRPVEDYKFWQYLQSLSTGENDVVQYYMILGRRIYLWPTPASDDNVITVFGRKKVKDMSLDDYTTGTITTATVGDETITASGSSWATNAVGNYIRIDYTAGDYEWYEIDSITDTTHLETVRAYEGASIAAGSATYNIGEFSYIPEQYHDIMIIRSLALFYENLEDKTISESYWRRYDGGVEAGLYYVKGGLIGGMLADLMEYCNSKVEGIYFSPEQDEPLSIRDLALPDDSDISIEE